MGEEDIYTYTAPALCGARLGYRALLSSLCIVYTLWQWACHRSGRQYVIQMLTRTGSTDTVSEPETARTVTCHCAILQCYASTSSLDNLLLTECQRALTSLFLGTKLLTFMDNIMYYYDRISPHPPMRNCPHM